MPFIYSTLFSTKSLLFILPVNSRGFIAVAFVTRTLTCFTELYNNFYKNGEKCVPSDIYNMLIIQGLSHWICDGWYLPTNTKFYSY